MKKKNLTEREQTIYELLKREVNEFHPIIRMGAERIGELYAKELKKKGVTLTKSTIETVAYKVMPKLVKSFDSIRRDVFGWVIKFDGEKLFNTVNSGAKVKRANVKLNWWKRFLNWFKF
jgi:hypothetical protein